jgi:hypothetical protein
MIVEGCVRMVEFAARRITTLVKITFFLALPYIDEDVPLPSYS